MPKKHNLGWQILLPYKFCGDHFVMYINVKPLYCIHETNTVCQLYFYKKIIIIP